MKDRPSTSPSRADATDMSAQARWSLSSAFGPSSNRHREPDEINGPMWGRAGGTTRGYEPLKAEGASSASPAAQWMFEQAAPQLAANLLFRAMATANDEQWADILAAYRPFAGDFSRRKADWIGWCSQALGLTLAKDDAIVERRHSQWIETLETSPAWRLPAPSAMDPSTLNMLTNEAGLWTHAALNALGAGARGAAAAYWVERGLEGVAFAHATAAQDERRAQNDHNSLLALRLPSLVEGAGQRGALAKSEKARLLAERLAKAAEERLGRARFEEWWPIARAAGSGAETFGAWACQGAQPGAKIANRLGAALANQEASESWAAVELAARSCGASMDAFWAMAAKKAKSAEMKAWVEAKALAEIVGEREAGAKPDSSPAARMRL
jgi:hypothetical protein